MKTREILAGILAQYFRYYSYTDAVIMARDGIKSSKLRSEVWPAVSQAINSQSFDLGEAFDFVANHANLPLDEDTEEEAYRWLQLFVRNVEAIGPVIAY